MSFQNLYYKRSVGTAKPCNVCHRPTTTVLSTLNTTDFIYTCIGHLSDPGFASEVKETSESPAVSAEEIAKVKEEWEKKEKEKREAKKEKQKDKEKPGETEGKDESKGAKVKAPSTTVPNIPASTPPKPSHQRYTLHRDYFAMRQAAHRRRRQASQAKELAPRLPGAPRGVLDSA